MKSLLELANEVIAGYWGNGEERFSRLSAAGYDPIAVQQAVNEILSGNDVDGSEKPPATDGEVLEVRVDLNRYSKIKLIIEV